MRTSGMALAAVLALIAVPGLAACGDGDDDSGSAATLTKQEYIAEADEICDELEADAQARRQEFESTEDQSDAALGELFEDFADIGQATVDDLAALPPPKGDEQFLEDFLAGVREQVDAVRQAAAAARSGDTSEVERLTEESTKKEAEVRATASEYGFKRCGNPDR